MGTIISAFLSAISSNSTNSQQQSAESQQSQQSQQQSAESQQSHRQYSLAKRKSKPELIIHDQTDTATYDNTINGQIHEFIWKYGAKESVILAGSFTNWQPSIQMVPVDHNRDYWKALVRLDPNQEWQFKFIVDGVWRCGLDLPTITDSQGNTNNIIKPE